MVALFDSIIDEFNINVFINTVINNTVHVCVALLVLSISSTMLPTEATLVMLASVPVYYYFFLYLPAGRRLFNAVKCWEGNIHRAFTQLRALENVGNHWPVMDSVDNIFHDWT